MNASPHLGQEVEGVLGPSVSRNRAAMEHSSNNTKDYEGKTDKGNTSASGHDLPFNRATGRADHQRPQCLCDVSPLWAPLVMDTDVQNFTSSMRESRSLPQRV